MGPESERKKRGTTLVEVVLVIVVLAILAVVALPALIPDRRDHSGRTRCMSNLKQAGIGLRLYSIDNNGNYPHFTNQVGNGYVWTNFAAAGKAIISPQVMLCSADTARWKNGEGAIPIDFSSNEAGFCNPTIQEKCLSYFYGPSAAESRPNTILAGDRNLTSVEPTGRSEPSAPAKWSYAGKGPDGGKPGIPPGGRSSPRPARNEDSRQPRIGFGIRCGAIRLSAGGGGSTRFLRFVPTFFQAGQR